MDMTPDTHESFFMVEGRSLPPLVVSLGSDGLVGAASRALSRTVRLHQALRPPCNQSQKHYGFNHVS